jgi:hypothetical protein
MHVQRPSAATYMYWLLTITLPLTWSAHSKLTNKQGLLRQRERDTCLKSLVAVSWLCSTMNSTVVFQVCLVHQVLSFCHFALKFLILRRQVPKVGALLQVVQILSMRSPLLVQSWCLNPWLLHSESWSHPLDSAAQKIASKILSTMCVTPNLIPTTRILNLQWEINDQTMHICMK